MSKRLATALLAAAALALPAPAALADAPAYDCRIRFMQEDDVTGGGYQARVVGVIAHPGGPVSIRCRITVNDRTVQQTYASGDHVAVAADRFTFVASDIDVVALCADYTSDHASGTSCDTLGSTQIPPQVVYDTLESVLAQVWPVTDPVICGVLQAVAPGTGPVYINGQGDVYVAGEPQWDCPPYDIVWE
ncbi:MAG TPA: hypothetical protein VNA20_18985 [Frankiaceae bacterium]|nr:hypothetical protein [Frankiaceae bacterium]